MSRLLSDSDGAVELFKTVQRVADRKEASRSRCTSRQGRQVLIETKDMFKVLKNLPTPFFLSVRPLQFFL